MVRVANNPFNAVAAVTRMTDGQADVTQIVGSAFVVGGDAPRKSALLVTAAHVVTDQAESIDTPLSIIGRLPGRDYQHQRVQAWHVRSDLDLAVGLIDYEPDLCGLQIWGNETFPETRLSRQSSSAVLSSGTPTAAA